MIEMSALDLILLGIAAYLAVITLVRMMRRRREGIIEDLTKEVELEQQRLKEERKKEKRRKMREQIEQQQRQRAVLPERDRPLLQYLECHAEASLYRNRWLPNERPRQRDGRGEFA